MRKIDLIVIHCSATPAGREHTAADIERWHKERGFCTIGYHYVVRIDGALESGRPESMVGAHCKGHNANSIGVCYIGGINKRGKPGDTRTSPQRKTLKQLMYMLRQKYPDAEIYGHNHFAAKECPCFDAHAEYDHIR